MVSMVSILIILVTAALLFVCGTGLRGELRVQNRRLPPAPRSVPRAVPVPASDPPPEDIGPDLLEHLNWMLAHTPAEERRRSRWVMDDGWFLDVRAIEQKGQSLWTYPRNVNGDFILYGLPVLLREGAGPPHLEPLPPGEPAPAAPSDGGYLLPVEDLPPVSVPARHYKELPPNDSMHNPRNRTITRPSGGSIIETASPSQEYREYLEYVEGIGYVQSDSPEKLRRAVETVKEQYRIRQHNAYGVMVLSEGAEYTPLSSSLTGQESAEFDAIHEKINQIDAAMMALLRRTNRGDKDFTYEKNLRKERKHLMNHAKAILNGPASGVIKLKEKKLSNMTMNEFSEARKHYDARMVASLGVPQHSMERIIPMRIAAKTISRRR